MGRSPETYGQRPSGPGADTESSSHGSAAGEQVSESITPKEARELRDFLKGKFALDVAKEKKFLNDSVDGLSEQDSSEWLRSFISSPPFSCPKDSMEKWIGAIIQSVRRNELPLCEPILGLAATLISIESGFQVDPLLGDPEGGEGVRGLLNRAESDLMADIAPLFAIPPFPRLYKEYRNRYYDRLLGCRTEGDIEVVAQEITKDIRGDLEILPEILEAKARRAISRINNVVGTKGSMQLSFDRAKRVMRDRGEEFTDTDLKRYIYTLDGGVDVGIAALKPMFIQYYAMFSGANDISWLFFVGMDYHYGAFSCRNMMDQMRLRDLSGMPIPIDGDFLRYDDKGGPKPQSSLTQEAARLAFPNLDPRTIFSGFLLEKDQSYIYTDIHKDISRAHEKSFGRTPFAMIGDLWMGKDALIKHGVIWKTDIYLKKLDARLGAIPWRH
jgi:hypothetical protein